MKGRELEGEAAEEADAVGEFLVEGLDVYLDTVHVADEVIPVLDGGVGLVTVGALDGAHRALRHVDVFFLVVKDDAAAVPASRHLVLLAEVVVDVDARDPLLADVAVHAPHAFRLVILLLGGRIVHPAQVAVHLAVRALGHDVPVEFRLRPAELAPLVLVWTPDVIPRVECHE